MNSFQVFEYIATPGQLARLSNSDTAALGAISTSLNSLLVVFVNPLRSSVAQIRPETTSHTGSHAINSTYF